jgi:hypothetical protein
MTKVAECAGYVVFKDSKVLVFYSNDLALTPTEPILSAQNESAVEAVRGLAVIKRWCGHEVFHRTKLKVPAIVAAYNMFMNAVDRMDQIRSTAPTTLFLVPCI